MHAGISQSIIATTQAVLSLADLPRSAACTRERGVNRSTADRQFAVTTGLTLLVLPFVKQAAKMNNHVQFLSHRNLARPIAKPLSAMPQAAAATATTGAPTHTPSIPTIPSGSIHSDPDGRASPVPADLSSSQLASLASIGSKRPSPIAGVATTTTTRDSPVLAAIRDKKFNDDEERSLYGALEGEHEYVSPWLGAQALGLATALVVGSAALGMWGVAKVMGVQSVRLGVSSLYALLLLVLRLSCFLPSCRASVSPCTVAPCRQWY